MEQKIINYVKEIAAEKGINICNETDLYTEGIFDSMEIILFLNFLDEELHVKFEFSDLDFENFKTIESILLWMEKRGNSE